MIKIKMITSVMLVFTCGTSALAQNLVPNPSFEEVTTPFCGIMTPTDFAQTLAAWINPTQASPSVYATNVDPGCYNFQPTSEYTGPIGIKGSQMPRTGEIMAGIWVYTIPDFNQRQYIQVQLETPLEVGVEYVVDFYVSLADSMEFYTNSLGAYLSADAPTSMNDGPLDVVPQVEADEFLDNAADWVLVSDTVYAEEAFNYITIGNFYNDESTETMVNPLASGAISTYGAYYFIDDIEVRAVTTSGVRESWAEGVAVYPTIFSDFIVIDGAPIETPSQIEIFNAVGALVYTATIQSSRETVDATKLSNGLYHIVLRTEESYFTKKVIKKN